MTLPTLLLGTAQWGWTVPRAEIFRLLDAWVQAGRRGIDAATNYPINRQPEDFRAAEKMLEDYIRAHGLHDLQVTMKVGSLDNLRSPESNLAPSFVHMMADEYRRCLGTNLHSIMFHWDNRADEMAIRASLEVLGQLQQQYGLRPGLSGIAHPAAYARANAGLDLTYDIQLKHNVLHSDLDRYRPLLSPSGQLPRFPVYTPGAAKLSAEATPPTRVFAYGINAGGVQLDGPYPTGSTFLARGGQPEQIVARLEQIRGLLPALNLAFVRPPVKTMNHLGLIYAGLHPQVSGLVLGFSAVRQLHETLDFWRNLETFDYVDVFDALDKMK